MTQVTPIWPHRPETMFDEGILVLVLDCGIQTVAVKVHHSQYYCAKVPPEQASHVRNAANSRIDCRRARRMCLAGNEEGDESRPLTRLGTHLGNLRGCIS